MSNTLLQPSYIYALGDYYDTPGLRTTCHLIKEHSLITEMRDAALAFFNKYIGSFPGNTVLVPIPSHNGYNETFCNILGTYLSLPMERILARSPRALSLYNLKKAKKQIYEEDAKIYLRGNVPYGNIILVDNVIDTGTTMSAALRVIGHDCQALAIAVNWKNYYKNTRK